MVNADFSPLKPSKKTSGVKNSTLKAGDAGFRQKPGFNTGTPGKTQSKDRSNGIKRAPVYPDSEGL